MNWIFEFNLFFFFNLKKKKSQISDGYSLVQKMRHTKKCEINRKIKKKLNYLQINLNKSKIKSFNRFHTGNYCMIIYLKFAREKIRKRKKVWFDTTSLWPRCCLKRLTPLFVLSAAILDLLLFREMISVTFATTADYACLLACIYLFFFLVHFKYRDRTRSHGIYFYWIFKFKLKNIAHYQFIKCWKCMPWWWRW